MDAEEYNSDDSSSDEETEQSVKGTAAAIVLINVFDPESRKSWEPAHVATCQLIRHYLRTQTTEYIGVTLYGTDNDDSSIFAQKYVTDIIPLSSPSLDDYDKLKNTDITKIKQSKELVLSEVLSHCSKMFSSCKKVLSLRTIIMLTSLDQAPAGRGEQEATMKYVEDIVKSGIVIKIVNIAQNEYQVHEFYNDFLFEAYKIEEEKDLDIPKHVWDSEEIKNHIITHCDRHLAIAELPFELGADLCVGVKIYKLLKSQTAPKISYIHNDTHEPIIRKRMVMKKTIDKGDPENNMVPLLSEEILKFQEYGGGTQEFTQTEYKRVKNPFEKTMLKLLGFKPADTLKKEKWFIESCYFLYPSEVKVEGSTIAFRALYHACEEMKVVAICMLLTRKNSRPRIVALSPTVKPFGINVDIGFDVIVLPFVENVRDLPEIEDIDATEISDEQKQEMEAMMSDIVDKVKFDYQPDMFESPVLQHKYRIIEAKALNDEQLPEIKDTTKPNEEIFKSLDEEKFGNLFGPFGQVVTKRVKETKSSSTETKKAKTSDIDPSLLQESIQKKTVDKFTADQLKQILKNLDITGLSKKRKAELVQLVYDNYT